MTQVLPQIEIAVPPVIPADSGRSLGRQGARFTMIGSAGTLTQLGLFAAVSPVLGAQLASIASWLISTLLTNSAHRVLTFGVRGGRRNRSDQLFAFFTCVIGLALTSIVLTGVSDATGTSGLLAILAVNTGVGAARFAAMRWWHRGAGHRVSHLGLV